MLRHLTEQNNDIIKLDAGNLMFGPNSGKRLSDKESSRVAAIPGILSELGYHAIGVGPYDLAGGVEPLISSYTNGAPWVSINLLNSSGSPIVSPTITIKHKDATICIAGITDSSRTASTGKGYYIADWKPLLQEVVQDYLKAYDMLILLSTLPEKENREIANDFKEVALIITATDNGGNIPPRQVNRALLTQTHARGKYLGILKGKWTKEDGWGDNNLQTHSQGLTNFRFRSLHSGIKNSPDIDEEIEKIKKQTAP